MNQPGYENKKPAFEELRRRAIILMTLFYLMPRRNHLQSNHSIAMAYRLLAGLLLRYR